MKILVMLTTALHACKYTHNILVDFCIISSVPVSIDVSFQLKTPVKWIFPISITIGGKSTFTITVGKTEVRSSLPLPRLADMGT